MAQKDIIQRSVGVGRDVSEGMMDEARRKADDEGLENVEFATGVPHLMKGGYSEQAGTGGVQRHRLEQAAGLQQAPQFGQPGGGILAAVVRGLA